MVRTVSSGRRSVNMSAQCCQVLAWLGNSSGGRATNTLPVDTKMHAIARAADDALIGLQLFGGLEPMVDAQAGSGTAIDHGDHELHLAHAWPTVVDLSQSKRAAQALSKPCISHEFPLPNGEPEVGRLSGEAT